MLRLARVDGPNTRESRAARACRKVAARDEPAVRLCSDPVRADRILTSAPWVSRPRLRRFNRHERDPHPYLARSHRPPVTLSSSSGEIAPGPGEVLTRPLRQSHEGLARSRQDLVRSYQATTAISRRPGEISPSVGSDLVVDDKILTVPRRDRASGERLPSRARSAPTERPRRGRPRDRRGPVSSGRNNPWSGSGLPIPRQAAVERRRFR
jgi:hypothetical protein